MERPNKCPKCGHQKFWKNGFACEKQRWKCSSCKHQFTKEEPQQKGKAEWMKLLALCLYSMRMSIRSIARLLKISATTVLNWIREYTGNLEPSKEITEPVIVEFDEMWHYINKKNKNSGSGRRMMLLEIDSSTGKAEIAIVKP